ncbi:hypothetical protein [Paenibacillus sp. L3-i20]|uniref:hypothetical protein n=1 Tax=Paenibacillus sp. L3-i20 TaxID=2905833 RepID=UPI001EDE7640|nr:hypothetical protein [Paenibacillus sp. L3-i20]
MSFEDLLKELQEQKANKDDSAEATLERLFNESFMNKHSYSKSFQEFLEKGNFQAWTQEDVNLIPEELWNRHVARETKFADWKTMLETANSEFAKV